MSIFQSLYQFIPLPLRNRYAFTIGLFVLWLVAFDSNTFWSQWQLRRDVKAMEEQRAHYKEQIADVEKSLQDLLHNDATKERFARENYLMKRPDEDIFVIATEE